MRFLVTGITGLLGPYLAAAASSSGEVVTTGRTGGDIRADLADPDQARDLLTAAAPDVVVHAAAFTDVDACEQDPAAAELANHVAVRNLVEALAPATILVAISTDQVYPDTPGLHAEEQTGPVNVYGETKLAGQRAAAVHDRSLILRTNLLGRSRTPGRASISDFMTQALSGDAPATLFSDVLFSPLHMETVADVVMTAVERGLTGTYNAGSRDGMSKLDFGLAIAQHLGFATDNVVPTVSTSLGRRARRPLDLRLDVTRLEQALGRTMPTLHDEVRRL